MRACPQPHITLAHPSAQRAQTSKEAHLQRLARHERSDTQPDETDRRALEIGATQTVQRRFEDATGVARRFGEMRLATVRSEIRAFDFDADGASAEPLAFELFGDLGGLRSQHFG